jgi:hypothetical protein
MTPDLLWLLAGAAGALFLAYRFGYLRTSNPVTPPPILPAPVQSVVATAETAVHDKLLALIDSLVRRPPQAAAPSGPASAPGSPAYEVLTHIPLKLTVAPQAPAAPPA